MNAPFNNRCRKAENISEKSAAHAKAAVMQLKDEQLLDSVQDQLNRKEPPHGVMGEPSAG